MRRAPAAAQHAAISGPIATIPFERGAIRLQAVAATRPSNHFSNGEQHMVPRRFVVKMSAIMVLTVTSAPALAVYRRASAIRMIDTDNDGTIDLAEAKKAATALFARLDRDHDGTLDKRELAGRLSAREFAAADLDHDGSLTLDEYLAVVEQRFNAANVDKDGTLDRKELNSAAGRALLRLLK
jgi:Ca2+-binding EF-hand superfamily protein